eukprot:Hpha_TRINITY_DN16504_c5_g3::TRINITY_DN16504_c5_g3_i1::g.135115::m.135115
MERGKPGPSSCSGMSCFLSSASALSAVLLVSALADPAGWWKVCDTTPCGAPVSLTGQPNCRHDMNKTLRVFFPGQLPDVCDHQCCWKIAQELSGGSWTPEDKERVCLMTEHVLDFTEDTQYVTFGHVCCSVCMDGMYGLPAFVFAQWALRNMRCGLFQCSEPGFTPAGDWCPERAKHVHAVQVFAVLATIVVGCVLLAHLFDAILGTIEAGRDRDRRRAPLPHILTVIRPGQEARGRFALVHLITTAFCFIAAVTLTFATSRYLCGVRLSDYVNAGGSLYLLWIITALEATQAALCWADYLPYRSRKLERERQEAARSPAQQHMGSVAAEEEPELEMERVTVDVDEGNTHQQHGGAREHQVHQEVSLQAFGSPAAVISPGSGQRAERERAVSTALPVSPGDGSPATASPAGVAPAASAFSPPGMEADAPAQGRRQETREDEVSV